MPGTWKFLYGSTSTLLPSAFILFAGHPPGTFPQVLIPLLLFLPRFLLFLVLMLHTSWEWNAKSQSCFFLFFMFFMLLRTCNSYIGCFVSCTDWYSCPLTSSKLWREFNLNCPKVLEPINFSFWQKDNSTSSHLAVLSPSYSAVPNVKERLTFIFLAVSSAKRPNFFHI